MSKVIRLGDYKNLYCTVAKADIVTEEEIRNQIDSFMKNQVSLTDKEGTVEEHDVVTLDFEGFKDGVAFEGGKAEGYQLEIGSHTFIPGFEEQMVGMAIGEEAELHMSFPENYGEPTLAGRPVIFKVKVHAIQTKQQAELNDAFVASLNVPSVNTVEDFRNYTRMFLEDQAAQKQTSEKENKIFNALLESCEVELDDADITVAVEKNLSQMEQEMMMQGFTLDQYLEMTGLSKDVVINQLRQTAVSQVSFETIIDEIIRCENVITTDEEIDTQIMQIAMQNGLSKEDVLARISTDDLKRDITRIKASQIVLESATCTEE
ncbi:MAG: trigger factor [Erysipelotrichaceae bacterium]|nr:trigger factor [Erysipelotrichaceae bacterium]